MQRQNFAELLEKRTDQIMNARNSLRQRSGSGKRDFLKRDGVGTPLVNGAQNPLSSSGTARSMAVGGFSKTAMAQAAMGLNADLPPTELQQEYPDVQSKKGSVISSARGRGGIPRQGGVGNNLGGSLRANSMKRLKTQAAANMPPKKEKLDMAQIDDILKTNIDEVGIPPQVNKSKSGAKNNNHTKSSSTMGVGPTRPSTEFIPDKVGEGGTGVHELNLQNPNSKLARRTGTGTKLKPLKRGKSKSAKDKVRGERSQSKEPFKNVAEEFLKQDAMKQQELLASKKDELNAIDDDLEDFMNVATDGNYNLKLLNDAFEGIENEEIKVIQNDKTGGMRVKKSTKRPSKYEDYSLTSKPKTSVPYRRADSNFSGSGLDAIMEQNEESRSAIKKVPGFEETQENEGKGQNEGAGAGMALVPMTYESQMKARNNLLRAKAKAMASKEKATKGEPRVLFDVDEAEERTFVTGGGLPKK